MSYPHADDFTTVLANEQMFNAEPKPFLTAKNDDLPPVFIVRSEFDAKVLYGAIMQQIDRLCGDLANDFNSGVEIGEMVDHLFATAETLKHLNNMATHLRIVFKVDSL